MLQTQVSYWANKENARHNLMMEEQNLTDLQRKQNELKQTIRYQSQQVAIAKKNLNEVIRHNKVQESLGFQANLQAQRQAEAALKQAEAALQNANTNYLNAQTNVKNAETRVYDARTQRSKVSSENLLNLQRGKESKVNRSLTKTKTNWYTTEHVALPILTSLTGGIVSGIARSILKK